jgi:hypothetical protein
MKLFLKLKKLFSEYWEIFVGLLVLLVGVVIGTSGSREKVLKEDSKAKEKARVKSIRKTEKAIIGNQKKLQDAEIEKEQKEKEADQKQKDVKKELLKDPDKLDKILEEKYGLEGE